MAHQRTLIREAVIAVLEGATVAADRVHDSRVDALKKGGLPAICVFTPSDPVELDSADNVEQEHTLELEVVAFVRELPGVKLSRTLDDLCTQIEAAMLVDPQFGVAAMKSRLVDTTTEFRPLDGAGDPLVGVAILTYDVTYSIRPEAPTLDDFLRAKATHKLTGGVPDTAPAVDEFTVQETPP